MNNRRLKFLLLCDYREGTAGTIIDHIFGIQKYSRHDITIVSSLGDLPGEVNLNLYDGLIIHYSLVACLDVYISPTTRLAIRQFRGFKVAYIQDDYRFINDSVRAFRAMRINALFGLAPVDIINYVYDPKMLPGVVRKTVLAGYVPVDLTKRDVPPLSARPIDVGYRARKLPAWMGAHTLQKWQIADRFIADAVHYDLKCDISYEESARIYGEEWITFLTNCRAVLGTESGASICDFNGDIQRNVEAHLSSNPNASFEELRDLYFKDEDWKYPMNVISPRCFEAAALRTLMILYEGGYSGRLQPWRHYIPLAKDHSNMTDVVALLRDPARAQDIIDRAYEEVALNPDNHFEAMVHELDEVIDTNFKEEMRAEPLSVKWGGITNSVSKRATILLWRLEEIAFSAWKLLGKFSGEVRFRLGRFLYCFRTYLPKLSIWEAWQISLIVIRAPSNLFHEILTIANIASNLRRTTRIVAGYRRVDDGKIELFARDLDDTESLRGEHLLKIPAREYFSESTKIFWNAYGLRGLSQMPCYRGNLEFPELSNYAHHRPAQVRKLANLIIHSGRRKL